MCTWSRRKPAYSTDVANITGKQALRDALPHTDVVVCLLPLTAETVGMLNADFMRDMKQGSTIVNGARGAHIVEADLLDCLDDGAAPSAMQTKQSVCMCSHADTLS